VGIFFQQDSDTNEVFIKTVVTGGSADRSGVIRVNDVVVRVDHDNVEGQPLSDLRSRILGRQGSYVTLGFRRKDGMETTYYDVPLMRGSPEYFDSLKANQPVICPPSFCESC
jgi:C-terminal processing protease CtpA/Prc